MNTQDVQIGDKVKFKFVGEKRIGVVIKRLKRNCVGSKKPTFRISDGKTVFRVEAEDIIEKI